MMPEEDYWRIEEEVSDTPIEFDISADILAEAIIENFGENYACQLVDELEQRL